MTDATVVRFSPYWGSEDDILELGFNDKPPYHYDDPNALEHRLCRANGLTYGCPPRHWAWTA